MSTVLNKSKRKRITIDAVLAPVPPALLPQTGVWLARAAMARAGTPVFNGYVTVTSPTGELFLTRTSPLSDWGHYPKLILTGFEAPPSMQNLEWIELRCTFSVYQSKTMPTDGFPINAIVEGSAQINMVPAGGDLYYGGAYCFYGLYGSVSEVSHHLFTAVQDQPIGPPFNTPFGYKDDLQDSLLMTVLTESVVYGLGSSVVSGPTPSDPSTFTIEDTVVALYYKAIRINCGSSVPLSLLQERYPLGHFTFIADTDPTVVSGGSPEVLHDPETTLYDSRRHGAGTCTYTFDANLFKRYYTTANYLVMLYFTDPVSTEIGQNVFDVSINGTSAGTLDIFALAGGANTPYMVEYPVTIPSADNLVVMLTATTGEWMISGLRVAPSPTPDPTLVPYPSPGTMYFPFKIYADGSRLEWLPCGADQRSAYQQAVLSSPMHPSIGGGGE